VVPTLQQVREARTRIAPFAIRTPLVRIDVEGHDVWLKLENLQPIGAFKIRGAASAMTAAPRDALARGVYTASAGNMAQGVAYCARAMGVPCTVIVPDRAAAAKVDAIERLGASVMKVSFDEWWQTMVDRCHPSQTGFFVHPFEDSLVMAGNGTIALEISEDLPGVDYVFAPWGGGGLSCGIAAALRELRPDARVVPIEVDVAAPLTASYAAGRATEIVPSPNFVDGMSGKSVFPRMWEAANALLDRPRAVSVAQIADALRYLVSRAHIVPEGAGAAPFAAARSALGDSRVAPGVSTPKIVCVVSGGNIDHARLVSILRGELP